MCAKLLPEIYEKHFGRSIGVSRSAKGIGGPGVRFVESALKELGINSSKSGQPLGREGIVAHLKARKKSQGLPTLDELVPVAAVKDSQPTWWIED